jgi:hypothetical protein
MSESESEDWEDWEDWMDWMARPSSSSRNGVVSLDTLSMAA